MTVRQQWAIVGGVVAVLAGALYAGTRMFGEELFPIAAGSRAPGPSWRSEPGTWAWSFRRGTASGAGASILREPDLPSYPTGSGEGSRYRGLCRFLGSFQSWTRAIRSPRRITFAAEPARRTS